MKNVTEILKQEHQTILKAISIFQDIVNSGNDKSLLLKGEAIINFIQNFADRYHHRKEEEILFRELEKPGVLTHCNPLPQMLHEHEEGRSCVRNMIEALEKQDAAALGQNIKKYGSILQEHIFKEDNILYPMAEEGLSEEKKELILKEYAEEKEELADDWLKSLS